MGALQHKLESRGGFAIGAELVSTRGTVTEKRAERTVAYARELSASSHVDWVSITDNAGGNPMLAPAALGGPIRDAGREVVIHLSCKDFNRNGLESEAWQLASEGFHNLLVLSGDAAGTGIAGGAKPVFDIDSVGLLWLLGRMNAGLDVTRPGATKPVRLGATTFYSGCVVTNFKRHENELVPQLLKLEKKISVGARWVINQIGYDARKMSELIAWLRRRELGHVPLIGNVYVLNPAVARVFRAQRIPGVVIADELAAVCERHDASADRGKAFFLELAAKQIAIYRGLGYRGAYLGGIHTIADFERVLQIERGFGVNDWRHFVADLNYARADEFFLYAADPDTGLANPDQLSAAARSSSPVRPPLTYRFSKFAHEVMFTPGGRLWHAGTKLCRESSDSRQGPRWLRALEHASKSTLFGCKDCGDCSLPDIAFLCPESACAKNQRNGPCGGTRDGQCEVGDFPCIWARAYDRLKSEHRAEELLAHAPVLQDQNLRGTSSWANTWMGRDHLARPAPAPDHAPVAPFDAETAPLAKT